MTKAWVINNLVLCVTQDSICKRQDHFCLEGILLLAHLTKKDKDRVGIRIRDSHSFWISHYYSFLCEYFILTYHTPVFSKKWETMPLVVFDPHLLLFTFFFDKQVNNFHGVKFINIFFVIVFCVLFKKYLLTLSL